MHIRSIRTFTGPNVFHHRPVLLMTLDLQELTEKASTDIPGFTERLIEILPGIREHHCSPGHVGGFIERLRSGTYFAHITEHVALELSDLAGIGVHYGKSIYGGEEGVYQIAVRYKCEHAMRFLLGTSVNLVHAAVEGIPYSLNEKILEAKKIIKRNAMGPSTLSLLKAAQSRGIPWTRVNEESLIQLGYGKNRRLIEATTTSITSDIAVRIAQDKDFAKKILEQAALPVPRGMVVRNVEEALNFFDQYSCPMAMKPVDGNHGKGVSINIKTHEEVRHSFDLAVQYSPSVIIEECFSGNDYRVLVVGGKMVAASHRVPAHVTGDGKSSVRVLIESENKNPLRGEGHEKPMTLISVDESINLDAIPSAGEVFYLKETANLSTGGSAEDVTDIVHEDNKVMCERAARIIGLDVCGIDLILEDISQPWFSQKGGIIEVNAGPGIRMHLYPSRGKSRDVGMAIIDHLFPKNRPSRIPVISITGTNGKTTVTRLITHIISGLDLVVGNTTTDGIFINGKQVASGDTTGPASAKVVLSDPSVEVAVLETARGGIMKRGLGYDWSDVGIITNIQADHIGQDGIENLDDILRVKSLVAERVRDNGFVILNADSIPLQKLMEKNELTSHGRKLVLFSRDLNSEIIQRHIEEGHRAYVCHDGSIYEFHHRQKTFIIDVNEIPLTVGGTAAFQIENVLAAFAACDVMEVPLRECLEGLRTFHSVANAGRSNLYQIDAGYALIDYGHNPEAIRALGHMLAEWHISKTTLVLGVPGDRSNEMIRLSGIAASNFFDRIIIREDNDRRGRAPGEIADLLYHAIKKTSPDADARIVLDPAQSLESALDFIEANELIVYLYEDISVPEKILRNRGGVPLHDFSRFISIKAGVQEVQAWH